MFRNRQNNFEGINDEYQQFIKMAKSKNIQVFF